ncbi:MAG: hypothetical protein CFE45_00645 [Burkholderiales bacterium PBB5]|nr:MAG: hypothetical protein CFE45_00645 [Burkholderiales bacterium PBB5]
MTFQMQSVSFEDTSLGMSGTRTEDGQALSVLFDHLHAESQADDTDAAPQVRRAEGVVNCDGSGAFDEPFSASVTAPVGPDGLLRLSLLLLAQRDLVEVGSGAACWVDSIDIAVTPDPRARRAR